MPVLQTTQVSIKIFGGRSEVKCLFYSTKYPMKILFISLACCSPWGLKGSDTTE